jgi:hypothetical protein
MNIVLYSDSNYEYQVYNLIRSLKYAGVSGYKIYYYNIGFESKINDPNIIKIRLETNGYPERLEYYKPSVCIDILGRVDEDFYFMDTDIMVSKRFGRFPSFYDIQFPGFCRGPLDCPYTFWDYEFGRIQYDENKLMNYLGVTGRTNSYIMSCFFTFNRKCLDFLEEWESFCLNKYLLKKKESIFPFSDETIANVLLWKRNIDFNYGRRFINTHKFSTFKMCEENDDIFNCNIDSNIYEKCEDSSQIFFYHGTKVNEENEKILNYIDENS